MAAGDFAKSPVLVAAPVLDSSSALIRLSYIFIIKVF